jgi:nucleoside phosphorylase
MGNLPRLSHREYTVGWISALPVEMAAARAMLDELHEPLSQDEHDQNAYTLGRIGAHNVVITCLPVGGTGTSSAANVATQMLTTFTQLRLGLMVGVGGGVPGDKVDIRLGDVAVSEPTDTHGGTIQYDLGKSMPDGQFFRTGMLNKPRKAVLTALSSLKAKHLMDGHDFLGHLLDVLRRHPAMADMFARPSGDSDTLYEYSYDHPSNNPTCSECNNSRLVPRHPRPSLEPIIHYGLIGSGNQVMRDGAKREKLREAEGVICFEMEAAGLMDIFSCLVIRGICDYSDSHKHKIWQPYAAMMAACYAKELLSVISGTPSMDASAGAEMMGSPGECPLQQRYSEH